MDTDSFIAYLKTDDIYKDIAEDVESRFDTSNYELDRPLTKGKNKKVTGLMENKLGGKTMTKFVVLRAKTYSYLVDNGHEDKKAKKEFIKNNKLILKTKQRFKIRKHNIFTEGINKIALNSSDHKRMQSVVSIETYAYGTSKDLVNEKEEIKCNNIIK